MQWKCKEIIDLKVITRPRAKLTWLHNVVPAALLFLITFELNKSIFYFSSNMHFYTEGNDLLQC